MNESSAVWAITGLALITWLTRGLLLIPREEVRIPAWLQRALKVAPLAALVAVVTPEVAMSNGHVLQTWQDARLPAVLAATLCYAWRPGVLGPMLAGLALFLPLRIMLGW
jgi:branched-subunit amino acid transport protein